MSSDQLQSLIRHMATAFGGYLIAKIPGLTPEFFEAIVGGAAALAAVVWGLASKKPSITSDTKS